MSKPFLDVSFSSYWVRFHIQPWLQDCLRILFKTTSIHLVQFCHCFAWQKNESSEVRQVDPHILPLGVLAVVLVGDVRQWYSSRRLQLNPKKTYIIWFDTSANLAKLNTDDTQLHCDADVIEPVTVIRDLGVYLDNELSMKQHIARVTRSCFYPLRRIRFISRQLGRDVTQQLVSSFVLSRLDYCNALLAELPASTLAPLQRVQNAAARLILNIKPSDHSTTALIQLHWLPVKYRIIYKICVLVHKALNELAPNYLRDLLIPVADLPGRSMLKSSMSSDLLIPSTKLLFGERANFL